MGKATNKSVRVEMSVETISRLLMKGQVSAAEMRCLDCKSKQCLWRLCLESCANRNSTTAECQLETHYFCQLCRPSFKIKDRLIKKCLT